MKGMRLQRHGMIQTKVSAGRKLKGQSFQKLDVLFVSFISGAVSLLLQSLVGGFTRHFRASRQYVAAGQSQRPQSSLNVSTFTSPACKAQTALSSPVSVATLQPEQYCFFVVTFELGPVFMI